MRHLILILFCSIFGASVTGQSDLETKLFELPDVIFKKIDTPEGYEAAYELKVRQAIDHKNPALGHFYQRVFLSHKDYNSPTAIITNGYDRSSNRITEIAEITGANQINVEHRYFGESKPDSMDYHYLNFEQITADLHHINQLFKSIYKGKWLSSGISKGGTTTIFYRYFYPQDVDVSIPYVAPVNHSDEDERIYTFLDTIGSDDCRAKIYAYQKFMLKKSDEIKERLKWYVKGKGLSFSYLNLDEAYEYAILEYPFSFWQYGQDCELIPGEKDNLDNKTQHFLDVVGLEFYADSSMENFSSHYYQSATEMGYYGYELEDFKSLIKYLPTDKNPSASFTPNKMKVSFDGALTNRVAKWTLSNPYHFIYINGALDTWSATAVPHYDSETSLFFFIPQKHHATARINNMSQEDQKLVKEKLFEWLNINEEENQP
jgi:hypothetical protein